MGDGQPNDGVRQKIFYGCVVTENTRGLPHWSSKGFRSRVPLIQPAKINSFVVMVIGWKEGGEKDFKRIKSFFPLSISLWWWGSMVSVYWLWYRCLGQMNVLIRREKHDGRIEWAMSVWDVSSCCNVGGKFLGGPHSWCLQVKFFGLTWISLRVKSAHDHEFTPNRLRSESEEKRNWISRLDHEPVVSR